MICNETMTIRSGALWDHRSLLGSLVEGRNGVLGEMKGFIFDDRDWTIHYLLLETSAWFDRRSVLITTSSVTCRENASGIIHTGLDPEQVKEGPRISGGSPLSRQEEARVRQYYELPRQDRSGALWNTRDMDGFRLWNGEGEIGRVSNLLIDGGSWKISRLVVEPYPGVGELSLLLPPEWIKQVQWQAAQAEVYLGPFLRRGGIGDEAR